MNYEPAYADQAREMCRLGATDEELAEHFEVCVRTIYRWRNTHEAFAEAVVAGKDHADARVERALYSRVVGCTVERTRVFKHPGEDPVYATYQHHFPPDATAALHWLRVRQPEKWRIRDEPEEEDELGDIIEEAFARAAERRLAEKEGQSDPTPPEQPEQPEQPPPPPPEPAPPPSPPEPPQEPPPAAPPEPEPAPAMEASPAPAPPPVPDPPDPGSAPASASASASAPAPKPPLFTLSRRQGYG